MRAREFVKENASAGATSSGGIATVVAPIGGVITRSLLGKPAKYANSVIGRKSRNKNVSR